MEPLHVRTYRQPLEPGNAETDASSSYRHVWQVRKTLRPLKRKVRNLAPKITPENSSYSVKILLEILEIAEKRRKERLIESQKSHLSSHTNPFPQLGDIHLRLQKSLVKPLRLPSKAKASSLPLIYIGTTRSLPRQRSDAQVCRVVQPIYRYTEPGEMSLSPSIRLTYSFR